MIDKNGNKRLILLDAHAIIHRAYHALPDFASSKGKPTGGLYGLSSMLMKVINDFEPDYMIACYDLPGPTHRHEVFEEYKAGRVAADDDLREQLTSSRDVFEAFQIPILESPGFEADDILGTLVKQLKGTKGLEIIIASGDHDTLQLVSGEKVRVFTMRKGLSDTVIFGEEEVRTRYGFGPELIPDYKGLRGDPSDNIPGVKGIGEKTATELVTTFGGVDDIYKALKKLGEDGFIEKGFKARVVKLLTEGEDDAVFSKMIATIRDDAPVAYTLPKKTWREDLKGEPVLALFDELEFRTLATRVRKLLGLKEEQTSMEMFEEEAPQEFSKEVEIATWLLRSDLTTPSREDVLRFAGTEDMKKAEKFVFAELKKHKGILSVYETIEKPLIPVLARMEEVGIGLDTDYLETLSKQYHKELEKIRKSIYKHAGREFNIQSPKQLGEVLYDELGLMPERAKRTETGQRSTRESELEKIKDQHPIVEEVLAYRELQKLLSTYIDAYPEYVDKDGRVHGEFLQTGSATGRFSSQNPNLQNIPIRTEHGQAIRNAFVAKRGFEIVALDYSQIELRIAAVLSKDKRFIEIFKDGGDVHAAVASEVFGVEPRQVDKEMRRRAKVINFGILYGMGVNALRISLGEGTTRNEAQEFLNAYFAQFSGLASYLEGVKLDATREGFTETLFGRRRYFSGFSSHLPYVRAQAERMAINAPIQGTAADIIKLAMVRVHEMLEKEGVLEEVHLVLQVHDELVYEIKKDKVKEYTKKIENIMETIVPEKDLHGVPILVDAARGKNWGELKRM